MLKINLMKYAVLHILLSQVKYTLRPVWMSILVSCCFILNLILNFLVSTFSILRIASSSWSEYVFDEMKHMFFDYCDVTKDALAFFAIDNKYRGFNCNNFCRTVANC